LAGDSQATCPGSTTPLAFAAFAIAAFAIADLAIAAFLRRGVTAFAFLASMSLCFCLNYKEALRIFTDLTLFEILPPHKEQPE
jgi:hypothetical protein